MNKSIIAVVISLIVGAVVFLKPADESEEDVASSEENHSQTTETPKKKNKSSGIFGNFLSENKNDEENSPASENAEHSTGDHIVKVDNSQGEQVEMADSLERIQAIIGRDPVEGMTHLRQALFMSSYTNADKEYLFDQIVPKLSNSDAYYLSKDIMDRIPEPSLYEKALLVHTKDMDQAQAQKFYKSEVNKVSDENLKRILVEYAKSKGIVP